MGPRRRRPRGGTLVKWTPALAAVALVAWLLTTRRVREAVMHEAAFAATAVLVYAPFIVWSLRGARRLPAPERSLDHARVGVAPLLRPFDSRSADAHLVLRRRPALGERRGRCLQGALVLALVLAAARARTQRAAVALAALAPVAFLLTNRIFSPQFVLVTFAAWAFAAALLVRSRREQLWVGATMAGCSARERVRLPVRVASLRRDVGGSAR